MHSYTVLDVFTDGSDLDGELMQRVAREMNLSETVFLLEPEDTASADARVRIFTPGTELPFAGHPVLGTAFVVGEKLGAQTVRLQTGAGVVPIALRREHGRIVYGEMDQPLPEVEPFAEADRLLEALGVARSELPVECYRNGPQHVYVSLADQQSVSALRPDMTALANLGMFGVNCFAGTNGHYLTRMFAPALGIAEDPATGSAAGPLAVHLARHGRIPFGIDIEIRQGVEMGRPSLLYARVEGTPDRLERVVVGGSAVAVGSGEYRFH